MEERMLKLEQELHEMRQLFSHFGPLKVDLRIQGTVRPIIIFAHDPQPESPKATFEIVY